MAHPLPMVLIGDRLVPSLTPRIKANVDLAGHSQPLVPSKVSTRSRLVLYGHSPNNNSLIVIIVHTVAMVVIPNTQWSTLNQTPSCPKETTPTTPVKVAVPTTQLTVLEESVSPIKLVETVSITWPVL